VGVCTTTSDDARGSVAATVESFATVEFKDYYETLGVARDAPADAIKKAYRKLARKYHPDVSKEPDAGTRMAAINEAHTVLSDPEKRAAYDQLGRHTPGQEFRPPPGWDEGMEFTERRGGPESAEFSEFFSEIFGRMGREGVHARARAADGSATYPGNDHHARILLDLEDSFAGATRQVTLRAPRLDPKGYVVLEERTLSVGIPAGIREGQVIRLAGQGEPGIGNGKPGDLLLEVQFRPHARFRADGSDLRITLPVAPWEAALGAVIPLEVPGGAINVRIPEGAQPGRRLRVRGKGLPSRPPGDLYIELRIVAPPAGTPKARELYEALAKETGFDARKEVP
jgi:curved DNA-binding protein